jgi:hypothetical protein
MRRLAVLLFLLLFLPAGRAEARRPPKAGRPLEVPPAPVVLDFGRVSPEEGEATAVAEIFVGEEGPLEGILSLTADGAGASFLRQGRFALRAGDGPFVAVKPGLDVVLGRASAPGGILRLEGRLSVPWEAAPGPFHLSFHLHVGPGTDVPLTLRGEVAEVLLLEGVPDRWTPRRDFDPSRDSSVAFGPQTLRVRANVPWRLVVRLAPEGSAAAPALFRQASLVFEGEGGRTEALAPGRSSTVWRGGPTSLEGLPVSLDPVLVFSGLPEEGTLELPLEIGLVREDFP